MRTTVTIDDNLLRKAKMIAARRGDSLKAVVEEGLREVIRLDSQVSQNDRRPPLVFHKTGGVRPGINLDKPSELLSQMDVWDAADRRQRADLRDAQ